MEAEEEEDRETELLEYKNSRAFRFLPRYRVSKPHDCQMRYMDVVTTFFSVQEQIYKEIKKKRERGTYDNEHFDWTATISSVEYLDVIVDVGDGGGWICSDIEIRHGYREDGRYWNIDIFLEFITGISHLIILFIFLLLYSFFFSFILITNQN